MEILNNPGISQRQRYSVCGDKKPETWNDQSAVEIEYAGSGEIGERRSEIHPEV